MSTTPSSISALCLSLGLSALGACYESHELTDHGAFELTCHPPEQGLLPGETGAVEARLDRALDPADAFAWALEGEASEGAELTPTGDGLTTTITPRRGGRFDTVFSFRDAVGRSARCESAVFVVVGEPYLRCELGAEVFARGRPLTLAPVIVEDEGIDELRFELLDGPVGMSLPEPEGEALTFVPTEVGSYRVGVHLRDVEGFEVSCAYEFTVAEPPILECPAGEARLFVGEEGSAGTLELVAEGPHSAWLSTDAIDEASWEGRISEEGQILLKVDETGTFAFRAHVRDVHGLESDCPLTVTVVSRDPWVQCPTRLATRALEPLELTARAGDEDGVVVEAEWALSASPDGSSPLDELLSHGYSATLTPVRVGNYRATFTVRDDDGREASCSTLVRSRAPTGLYIELYWDTEHDFDLHLLHPENIDWQAHGDGDGPQKCSAIPGCYTSPDWFEPGDADDPRLVRDIWWGSEGPEVIHMRRPRAGSYGLGAGPYHISQGREGTATVVIHCGVEGAIPRVHRLGPTFVAAEQFWRIAEIVFDDGGGCEVVEMVGDDGGPDVCWWAVASLSRSGYPETGSCPELPPE